MDKGTLLSVPQFSFIKKVATFRTVLRFRISIIVVSHVSFYSNEYTVETQQTYFCFLHVHVS